MDLRYIVILIAVHLVPRYTLQCQQKGYTEEIVYDCRSRSLSVVPQNLSSKAVKIDLSQNIIEKLSGLGRYTDIENLNLSHNSLTHISSRDFDRNKNLRILDLTLNRLRFDDSTISPRLFKHNIKISKLLLAGQYVQSESLDSVVDAILQLSNLEHLSISPINDELPNKLTNLPKLRVLNFQWGDIRILSQHNLRMYANTSIEQLSFHQCNVKSIENGTFDNFKNLTLLNVACNYDLDPANVITALSLSCNCSVSSLVLDGTTKKENAAWEVGKDDRFECQKVWPKLERLSLQGVVLNNIYTNVSRCISHLESFSWGFAKVRDSRVKNEVEYMHVWKILNLPRLLTVSAPYINHPGVFFGRHHLACIHEDGISPPENEAYFPDLPRPRECVQGHVNYSQLEHTKNCVSIPIGRCVKYVDFSHFAQFPLLDYKCLQFPKNIEFINISHWEDGKGTTDTILKHLNATILGLEKLKTLDISYSGVKAISVPFFSGMISLRILHLEGNKLHPSGFEGFPELKHLKTLNLNKNHLSDLHHSSLANLTALTNLSMQKNDLTRLSFLSRSLASLKYLDVSFNQITTLKADDTSVLEILNHASGNLLLLISNNPFVCGCYNLHFIKWFQSTKVEIHNAHNMTCTYSHQNILLKEVDTTELENKCKNIPLITSLSVTLPIVIFVVVLISYKKKWTIKWHYHVFKRYCRNVFGYMPYPEDTSGEPFHGFVIFPMEDDISRDWVFSVLRPKVESEWELKLHLFGRDDTPGAYVMDNVVDGIKASRKAIWLITPAFVNDSLCVHAAQFALCHNNVDSNVIVTLDNNRINNDRLPKSMANLLNPKMKIKRLKYTDQETGNRLFWDRLQLFILDDSFEESVDESMTALIMGSE